MADVLTILTKLPAVAYIDNTDDKSPGAPPVIAIRRGEMGYYPIYTQLTAEELNAREGISRQQAEAMHIGSMFGWDTKAVEDLLMPQGPESHNDKASGDQPHGDPWPLVNHSFDLIAHLRRQSEFFIRTFGPGERTAGVIHHIRKELMEIEAQPDDLSEWIDVILLALDGASRVGFSPEEIAQALADKQTLNESRQWPDWRTAEPGKAIEHIRLE